MPKPLMRDFMGLNGHTINFKPELYRPACKLVRDYHTYGPSWQDRESGTNAARAERGRLRSFYVGQE